MEENKRLQSIILFHIYVNSLLVTLFLNETELIWLHKVK